MAVEKVRLPNESETYLPTLYGKALDSRAAHPILGDTFADDVVQHIDFDFEKLHLAQGGAITLPMRAKHLDGWTREFLAANPRATVLHLGCGLDSRVFRLDPPPSVRWYDVDLPEVIALREQLYPARHDYALLATSVTDLRWLDEIPADRPVLVVAEGVVMYLPEPDALALFARITEQFPSGQFIFDAYSRLTVRVLNLFVRLVSLRCDGDGGRRPRPSTMGDRRATGARGAGARSAAGHGHLVPDDAGARRAPGALTRAVRAVPHAGAIGVVPRVDAAPALRVLSPSAAGAPPGRHDVRPARPTPRQSEGFGSAAAPIGVAPLLRRWREDPVPSNAVVAVAPTLRPARAAEDLEQRLCWNAANEAVRVSHVTTMVR